MPLYPATDGQQTGNNFVAFNMFLALPDDVQDITRSNASFLSLNFLRAY